ncbi:hypothetical protein C1646_662912 [Rhizophagus diaphanus]|nr:hypothetical protein C1646_662912 [Rhizophagus diaphanus] [Rhizophagus sp. MUCL 43196]
MSVRGMSLLKNKNSFKELNASEKRLEQRQTEIMHLTTFTTTFHEKMSKLRNCIKSKARKPKAVRDTARDEILKLSLNFNETIKDYYEDREIPEPIYSDTSDDTKNIERRPRKRDTSHNTNINYFKQSLPSKRMRPLMGIDNDFLLLDNSITRV